MGDMVAPAIGILVVGLVFAVVSLRVVKHDESIVIFRLGKSSPDMVRGPGGLHFIIPVLDRPVSVRLSETATEGTVFGTSKDDVALTAYLTILWRVVDPFKRVIQIDNPDEALKEIAGSALQDIDADDAIAYAGRTADAIEARLIDAGERWGITIAEVSVRKVSRT